MARNIAVIGLIIDVLIMVLYPLFCDQFTATRIANTILTVCMASIVFEHSEL